MNSARGLGGRRRELPLSFLIAVPFLVLFMLFASALSLIAFVSFRVSAVSEHERNAEEHGRLILSQLDTFFAGDLANGAPLDDVSRWLGNTMKGNDGLIWIEDESGLLLASSVSSEYGRLLLREARGTLSADALSPRFREFRSGGRTWLGDFVLRRTAAGSELGIGVVIPESAFISDLVRNGWIAVIMTIVTGIVVGILANIIAGEVTRPARSIRNRALALADGDWSGPGAEPGQARELVELAEVFEAMASALRDNLEGLESTVAQRTAELKMLLREVHHRIKNSLSLAASMLSLQASQSVSAEAAAALAEARGRILSMALLYDRLYRSPDLASADGKAYLEAVLDDLRKVFIRTRPIVLEADLLPVQLDPGKAAAVGIIVTEFVTNACKHAFPHDGGGRIKVGMKEAEGRLELTVRDNGAGFPPGFDSARDGGFGMTLIDTLAWQHGGIVEYRRIDSGTEIRVLLDVLTGVTA